jgi:membrane protease YdiL (CAAX protease family)
MTPTNAAEAVPLPLTFVSLAVLGLLVGSIVFWIWRIRKWFHGQPFLPSPEPARTQPWGLIDVVFAVTCWLAMQISAAAMARKLGIIQGDFDPQKISLDLQTWVQLMALYSLVIATAFIAIRCRTSVANIGWSLQRWKQDLVLGLLALIAILPFVYTAMGLATWLSKVPYKHPVMEAAKSDPSLLLPAFLMAVVAAPFIEEFGFRVLLQGLLESLAKGRMSLLQFFYGRREQIAEWDSSDADCPRPKPWWPVLMTSLLFGLAHFDYGVSWIPLSILGLALGWLYRHTQRIWPCVVAHLCFNGISMTIFAIHVIFKIPLPG